MLKTTLSLAVGAVLLLFGAQIAQARGFGGARGGSGYSAGGYHSGAYHEGGYHEAGASGEVYHGPGGTTVAHGTVGEKGAVAGPGGAAAGGKEVSGTAVKGPEGDEYVHESSADRGVAAGPNGAAAGGKEVSATAVKSPDGKTYAHGATTGAAGYGAARVALPTDAGYGAPAAATGTAAHAGYHQTEAVNGSVYAARGTAVRASYSGAGMYDHGWTRVTRRLGAAGWTGGQAWSPATWPAVGASLGWGGSVQPMPYDYGTNVTYQGDEVYDGSQPVATADQYYQQARPWLRAAPRQTHNRAIGYLWESSRWSRKISPIRTTSFSWPSISLGLSRETIPI